MKIRKETITEYKKHATQLLQLIPLSLIVGIICGLVGTVFVKSIHFVTELRENHGWILFLLPLSGLLCVGIYKLLKVSGKGTNHIIKSVRTVQSVSPLLSIAVFCGTVLSHFGGASVGREGAALQLGGSISEFFAKKFKLSENSRRILVMSGMSACFSALFGTPLAAFVFVLEVARVGKQCLKALIPALISSTVAFFIANRLGVEPERFPLSEIPKPDFYNFSGFILISVLGAIISMVFVYSLHFSEKGFKKIIKNEFLRVVAGGVIVVLLTLLLGTRDYNGGGISVVHHIFTHGEVNSWAFLLKIVFTALCVGSGFKGGEIVPTIFIGGTFGGSIAVLFGINPAFGAAIGITALFSGVTNCPVSTIILACEMFGVQGVGYFAVSSILSFMFSGKVSLYSGRKLPFAENK